MVRRRLTAVIARAVRAVAAVGVAAVLAAGPAVAARAPEASSSTPLRFDSPPDLERVARDLSRLSRVRYNRLSRLAGAEPTDDEIYVALRAEGSRTAAETPRWVAGYAYGALDRVVLFPERVPQYPNGSLHEVLEHELMHVFLARALAGETVPRWFNEGLATAVSSSWGFDDRSQLTWALLFRGRREIAGLEAHFRDAGKAKAAYAISGAFVRDLMRRYGGDAPARIAVEVRSGRDFESAFEAATGTTVARAEERFWRGHSLVYRWIPVISSSVTLWGVITFLAFVAFGRRRQRDARVRRKWEAEERAFVEHEEGDGSDVGVDGGAEQKPKTEWIH